MVSQKVTVVNKSGLHVRPAGVLVKEAEICTSQVEIIYKHNIVNAKSLLNILSASIRKGEEIEFRCTGPNEVEDLAHVVEAMNHLE